jgi:hypothetical protein
VYAPDGGKIVIIEDEIPAEPDRAELAPESGREGASK